MIFQITTYRLFFDLFLNFLLDTYNLVKNSTIQLKSYFVFTFIPAPSAQHQEHPQVSIFLSL